LDYNPEYVAGEVFIAWSTPRVGVVRDVRVVRDIRV